MDFEIITPDSVSRPGSRQRQRIYISLNHKGLFLISWQVIKLLNLTDGDSVVVVQDKNSGRYFIGNGANAALSAGKQTFLVRYTTKKQNMIFNNVGLVEKMKADLDLPLGNELKMPDLTDKVVKKTTVRLDVKTEPVKWNGLDLFEIY